MFGFRKYEAKKIIKINNKKMKKNLKNRIKINILF